MNRFYDYQQLHLALASSKQVMGSNGDVHIVRTIRLDDYNGST